MYHRQLHNKKQTPDKEESIEREERRPRKTNKESTEGQSPNIFSQRKGENQKNKKNQKK